jgi:trigger factor
MIVKNVEKKEHSTAIFQVEIDAESFEKAVAEGYQKAKRKINVPGFRKGKAPRVVIEGMYGKDVFHDDAVQLLAPDAFQQGAEESKLEVVGAPSIVDFSVSDEGVATVTFQCDVYPEITLGDYKGLEAEYDEPAVAEEAVQQEIEDARKRAARFQDVERPVQNGDTIALDFEGFVDGVAFDGGKAEDYSLEVGSGSFIPGFEDQLVGMEIGKAGEVHVTFPEAYDPKLAGKDATFKVLVKSVREAQYPELDDEFAKDVSEFDTLAQYTESVRARLLSERTAQSEADFRSAVVEQAAENMTCDVPESMLMEKIDEFLNNYADSMGLTRRVSREELIRSFGVDEKTFVAMMRPNAQRQVRQDLVLDAVAKAEELTPAQEDKDEFFKKLDEDYGENAEKVRELINVELLDRDLTRQAAAKLMVDSAVKTAPKVPEAETEGEDAPAQEKKPRRAAKKAETETEGEETTAEEKKPRRAAKKAKADEEAPAAE